MDGWPCSLSFSVCVCVFEGYGAPWGRHYASEEGEPFTIEDLPPAPNSTTHDSTSKGAHDMDKEKKEQIREVGCRQPHVWMIAVVEWMVCR